MRPNLLSLILRLGFLGATVLAGPAELPAQNVRRTPLVEAIEKTRPSIVTIKVSGNNGGNDIKGAGVIVDSRGVIVTNRHVTGGRSNVIVRLADGKEITGDVVLTDSEFDLAVVRIRPTTRLAALRFTTTKDLMVGESVVAIGNPFGYEGSVSNGIVSALNREIVIPNGVTIRGLIQHDAPINPGNSGGPLVNLAAEVIGMNIALREGAQNIAFAIDADTIDLVLSRLLRAERVAGVQHGLACTVAGREHDAGKPQVVVTAMSARSPAAEAGIEVGDIVLRIGAFTILNRFDAERALWDKRPDDKVAIRIRRAGKDKTLSMVAGHYHDPALP